MLQDSKDTNEFSENELLDIMYNKCDKRNTGNLAAHIFIRTWTYKGVLYVTFANFFFLLLSQPQEKCWPPVSCSTCKPSPLRAEKRTNWLPCDSSWTLTFRTLTWAGRLFNPRWERGLVSAGKTGESELWRWNLLNKVSCRIFFFRFRTKWNYFILQLRCHFLVSVRLLWSVCKW